MNDKKNHSKWTLYLWYLTLAFIGALRLYYCFTVPLYTTDVLRNIGFGIEFWHYGCSVYDLTPYDFSPAIYQYFWSNHYYTYPVITLLAYAMITKLWASIFFTKLVWTIVDTVNAVLIQRLTKDRWCTLLYFAHPIGLWFTSHEGQFEPLVNLMSLLGIYYVKQEKSIGFLFLALAVQTKLFPVFLFPYFVIQMFRRSHWKILAYGSAWGVLGFLPSLWAAVRSGYLITLFLPGYVPKLSPISWALFDEGMHGFAPFPLVLCHWIAGIVFVGTCLYMIKKENAVLPYLAPMVFVAFVKMIPMGQPWYLLLAPVMCLTVENPSHRRILFAMSWLFGIQSLWSIFIGPIGYHNPTPVMELLRLAMYGI